MKVSLLTPDFSENSTARAYIFAKVLKRHYDVEIIGPKFGNKIWEPLRKDSEIIFKTFQGYPFPQFMFQVPRIVKAITGDVIWANTPYFSSFSIGLLKKFFSRKPLILDMADWESGFFLYLQENNNKKIRRIIGSAVHFLTIPNSGWSIVINEKYTQFADELTVSNSFLQKKFGGTIIRHCRDTQDFNPDKFKESSLRKKYQIKDTETVVMFFGTPQVHKGIEDLIKAIDLIKSPNIILVIVGINERDPYCINLAQSAKEILGNRLKGFGLQPFDKIPEFLSIADIVVIPQRKNLATVGQVPAKLFDAMAMAKPIITTNVSDLPEILNGCGWIVEPENPEKLAETIKYVLDDPEEAEKMGQRARQKCVEKYSWDAMEKILLKIFKKYE